MIRLTVPRLRFGLTVLLSVIVANLGVAQQPAKERRPNFLFILADDQRFDTIRALGNNEIHTPNLDKLVKRGFAFHNTYCQGSMVGAVCFPSRTMIMTGRSLFRIPGKAKAKAGDSTLAAFFRRAGFATLFIGKRSNTYLPGNEAFDKVIYHKEDPKLRAQQSEFMADETIAWLRQRKKDQPFFIYLGPPVPHDPRVAPPEFRKMYDPAKITLSPNFMPMHPFDNGELKIRDELLAPFPRTPGVMKKHLAEYYACITCLDHHVGRIIEELEKTGELDNTVIIFTSDSGLAVGGRHGLMGKQNLYEENKSPLIFAGPGIPHGDSKALVYLYDLLPTVCDRAGIAPGKDCEGLSLMPVMKGEKKQVRDAIFGAYKDCQRMARDERWKIMWYPKIDRFQLFDLANDPWEIHDLHDKAEHAAKLGQMKKLLAELQERFADNIPRLVVQGKP